MEADPTEQASDFLKLSSPRPVGGWSAACGKPVFEYNSFFVSSFAYIFNLFFLCAKEYSQLLSPKLHIMQN